LDINKRGHAIKRLVFIAVTALLAAGLWFFLKPPATATFSPEPVPPADELKSAISPPPIPSSPKITPHYVGSEACADCHSKETQDWQQSHHFQAMKHANAESVLGNFDNSRFKYFGRETRFIREESETTQAYFVVTENQRGESEKFKVDYTLGYTPLQQYLVTFPDGRIQTLPFAWDTRPEAEGGQRWFHIYDNDDIKPDDPLFWTRPLQNWNHMCAECHTTQYSKNFNDKLNTFDSTWLEVGVGCESCHGPGSLHLSTVESKLGQANTEKNNAENTSVDFDWHIETLSTQPTQIYQCGVCHARRNHFNKETGNELLSQSWQPELLSEGLYFPDGQIQDEVFVTGSFMQSKMFEAGVTCSHCHKPHSLELIKEGNALCTQCHITETYDNSSHHFHLDNSEGSQCVNCHMPERTYMVVDPRRDHKFFVPRPDLSETLGTPNACNDCHQEKSAQWEADNIAKHFGSERPFEFGETFWQARREQLGAEQALQTLADPEQHPAIVSATAMQELANYPSPDTYKLLIQQMGHRNSLIRSTAVRSLAGLPQEQRVSLLLPMLTDKSKPVRFALAPLLADVDMLALPPHQQEQLSDIFKMYTDWLKSNADRSQSLVNLASFYLAQGNLFKAQDSFDKALARDEFSLPAYLNYADFFRSLENDTQAERLLREAEKRFPDSAGVQYSLGLLLVRTERRTLALEAFKQASEIAPNNSQYVYLYGVALFTEGQKEQAFAILEDGAERFPANQQILMALLSYYEAEQRPEKAKAYAEKLLALAPWNTEYQQLIKRF